MSGGKTDISMSGAKGVVVGDYATVFQSFGNTPPPVATFIRDGQFRSLVDERTRGFIGRDFIFDAVDQVLAGERFRSGYLLIHGEPGIGKTSLASMLVLRRKCVHHFNVASGNIRSARQFLENVCAQLIARFELDHATLPASVGDDSGFLSQLLTEAVQKAEEHDELPVVVVVDALDEADDTGLARGANRLFLPRTLPPGVFFVVTTREQSDFKLTVDHAQAIWIRDDDAENTRDVARYIETFVEQHPDSMHGRVHEWGIDLAEFVEQLTKLSEGNFMYLTYVLPEIERGELSQSTVGSVDALPRGLEDYYRRHWREMKDLETERFKNLQRPVLCYVAVSREPVTVTQVAEWTRLEPGDVRTVLREWREFLNADVEAKPETYRIYHQSFADFLDNEEDLKWYHAQIAEAALAKIPGFLDAS